MLAPFGLDHFETSRFREAKPMDEVSRFREAKPMDEVSRGFAPSVSLHETLQSCVISFTDQDLDPNIKALLHFIQTSEQYCCQLVEQHPPQWDWTYRLDQVQLKSSLKYPYFRLKIRPQTEIYDETGTLKLHADGCQLLTPWCYVMSLLELTGLWMTVKSCETVGGVSLLDETFISPLPLSPPPPPPPSLPSSPLKIVHTLFPCFAMITGGQYQLKKAQPNESYQGSQPTVSLNEILQIRKKLRKGGLQPHGVEEGQSIP
jgi:hypothetical protein